MFRLTSDVEVETRRTGLWLLGVAGLACLMMAWNAHAAEADEEPSPSPPETTADETTPPADLEASAPELPVYVPPRRGQPRARVGGGVRGPSVEQPALHALVPDHVAHTARSQPTLLWYLDRVPPETAELTFRFNLTNDDEIDPLIEVVLERPTEPGLQRIDLSSYDFSLDPGLEYQWSVALVTDTEHRARDVVTLGWIERVDDSEPLAASEGNADNAAALAAAGLWYDAVDVADRDERAALLDQVGIEPPPAP